MASILKGQSGQPIQFETKPNVNGDDVATEFDAGVGRNWTLVSRTEGVTYTNNSGRDIIVHVRCFKGAASGNRVRLFVDTVEVSNCADGQTFNGTLTATVPNGSVYSFSATDNIVAVVSWRELR